MELENSRQWWSQCRNNYKIMLTIFQQLTISLLLHENGLVVTTKDIAQWRMVASSAGILAVLLLYH